MKISAKTMAAVKRAAADRQMTVDAWAEKALARAAMLGNQSDIEAELSNISRKLDEISERQTFGEKANEQLATTVRELGTSFDQIKKRTGSVFDQVRSRTGSAVSEIAEKAMEVTKEVIGQVSRTTTELAGSLAPKAASEEPVEEAAEPDPATPRRKRKAATKRRAKAAEKSGRVRRRGSSPGKVRRRRAARPAT